MAGNADVRLYRIVSLDSDTIYSEIKGLAVKDNEAIVSTIDNTASMQTLLDGVVKSNGLSYPCKIGEQVSEDTLVTFTTAINDITTPNLFKLVEVFADRTIYEPEAPEEA